jgi:hypothetical protein
MQKVKIDTLEDLKELIKNFLRKKACQFTCLVQGLKEPI